MDLQRVPCLSCLHLLLASQTKSDSLATECRKEGEQVLDRWGVLKSSGHLDQTKRKVKWEKFALSASPHLTLWIHTLWQVPVPCPYSHWLLPRILILHLPRLHWRTSFVPLVPIQQTQWNSTNIYGFMQPAGKTKTIKIHCYVICANKCHCDELRNCWSIKTNTPNNPLIRGALWVDCGFALLVVQSMDFGAGLPCIQNSALWHWGGNDRSVLWCAGADLRKLVFISS